LLALDQQALERRTLARNELLFRQGDKVTAIYFIEVGRLRLERRTFDGRTLILGTTAANEFFVTPLHYHVCNSGRAQPPVVRLKATAASPSRLFTPGVVGTLKRRRRSTKVDTCLRTRLRCARSH
jgi:CRP-like cAMP-binding protein